MSKPQSDNVKNIMRLYNSFISQDDQEVQEQMDFLRSLNKKQMDHLVNIVNPQTVAEVQDFHTDDIGVILDFARVGLRHCFVKMVESFSSIDQNQVD